MTTPALYRPCPPTPCRKLLPQSVRTRGQRAWHTRRYITSLIAAAGVFDPTALQRLRNHARRQQSCAALRNSTAHSSLNLVSLNRLLAPSTATCGQAQSEQGQTKLPAFGIPEESQG